MTYWEYLAVVTLTISTINWVIYFIIRKKHVRIYEYVFASVHFLFLTLMFMIPLLNVISLIMTVIDVKNTSKVIRKEKLGLLKINNFDETLLNLDIKEHIDTLRVTATLLNYDVTIHYGLRNLDAVELIISMKNENKHHQLNILFNSNSHEFVYANLSIIERGTSIDMNTSKLDECLKLIESRL